jgi:hypothetical protein
LRTAAPGAALGTAGRRFDPSRIVDFPGSTATRDRAARTAASSFGFGGVFRLTPRLSEGSPRAGEDMIGVREERGEVTTKRSASPGSIPSVRRTIAGR